MWIDPADEHNHRLFACGAFDNIPEAKKFADGYDLTRLVLHYASALIRDTQSSFQDKGTQDNMRSTLTASINSIYQKEQMIEKKGDAKKGDAKKGNGKKGDASRKEKRPPKRWIGSKIFLDHNLIEMFLKVIDCHYGCHFAITISSLEGIFNKAELLPVSSLLSSSHTVANSKAQFLTVYFKDIYALIQDFNHPDNSIASVDDLVVTLTGALETQPDPPGPSDIASWRREAIDFETCWLPLGVRWFSTSPCQVN